MDIDATPAAAMRLRVRLRSEGVTGMPGIRVRPGHGGGASMFELVIEDRAEPADRTTDARGIRFYLDPVTAERVGGATLDLEGDTFILRLAQ